MNKLFIVVLAVCLITVNCAVVKREAEEGKDDVNSLLKKITQFAENTKAEFEKNFNPENIKKQIDEVAGTVNKWIDDANKKPEVPQQ